MRSGMQTYFFIVFYSGRDASHPEILLFVTVIIPAAPQETVGKPGSNSELLRGSLVFSCFLCFQEQSLSLRHTGSKKIRDPKKNSSRIRIPDPRVKKPTGSHNTDLNYCKRSFSGI
jgi:hypothetical protein